jgi:polyisoprenoid-binding protein YceI
MNRFFRGVALSLYLSLGLSSIALGQSSAAVDVTLSPAGSFVGKTSDVKGEAIQTGDTISASNIIVNLSKLKTGVETRDKHTLKYLETDKYPHAILVSATGKAGKGEGKIKIKDIEKDIAGTYKVSGGQLEAEFPLKLSDFKISGIRYMGVGVKDDIKIRVTVPMKTVSAAPAAPKAPAKATAPAPKANK